MTFCSLNPTSCQLSSFLATPLTNTPLECSANEHLAMSNEIFRMTWITGEYTRLKIRDCIGPCFQNNTWTGHPFFGGLQLAYNQMSEKVAQLTNCSKSNLSSAIQKSWNTFNYFLAKEEIPSNLRSELLLETTPLGVFSNTPLVISTTHSDLPNVITPTEFKNLLKVYQSIKNGTSDIQIEGSEEFKAQVLSDIRIILSTKAGRELIYSLHKIGIQSHIVDASDNPSLNSKANYFEDTIYLSDPLDWSNNFGSLNTSIDTIEGISYPLLFHEASHLLKNLVFKSRMLELTKKAELKSQECQFLEREFTFINESTATQQKENCKEQLYAILPMAGKIAETFHNSVTTRNFFDIFTTPEERRVINLTNTLRGELFMSGGKSFWKGRCSHGTFNGYIPLELERLTLLVMNSLYELHQSLPATTGTCLRRAFHFINSLKFSTYKKIFDHLPDNFKIENQKEFKKIQLHIILDSIFLSFFTVSTSYSTSIPKEFLSLFFSVTFTIQYFNIPIDRAFSYLWSPSKKT